jgi:peptide/nickel transport system substrate-binding protein
MKIKKSLSSIGLALSFIFLLVSCDNTAKNNEDNNDNAADKSELNIHELGDPDGLNPITSTAANSLYIQNNLFCKLLVYDPQTLDLVPQLAVSRPEINVLDDGGMSLTFEILAEATWDNGTPVTAEDYVFTLKSIRNPKVNSAQIRPYFEFIDRVEIDPSNNKKFTVYSSQRYFRAEESCGQETFILPEYHYDPEGIMRKFTVQELGDPQNLDKLKKDPSIIRFAEEFNDPKYSLQKGLIVGCGPYSLTDWETRQRIVLERKENWWGYKLNDNKTLQANPPRIVYKTIPDITAAIANAKDGQLDVIRSIQPTKFIDLKDDANFHSTFDLSQPEQFAYYYVGFNMKKPQFKDKRVRRAIAHLINRDEMIESIFESLAVKTNGPINPKKKYYNNELEDIAYDIDKAKTLLAEAGWKDSDGDNILDKMIAGKKRKHDH